jgi:branched-chain amino acid transport system ATP-binding protein
VADALVVRSLRVSYGAVEAVRGIDVTVGDGEAVAVVGSNGAGKSSTLRGIMGLVAVQAARLEFGGTDLRALPTFRIARLGIGYVPEGRELFPGLTVEEELLLGGRLLSAAERKRKLAEVFELFPRLAERKRQITKTLSGGEQQMLALGRTLMRDVRVLLLDEPSLGLAPVIQDAVYEALARLHAGGLPMLLVEQNVYHALNLCERACVLELGRIVREGRSADLLGDAEIRAAYLGA